MCTLQSHQNDAIVGLETIDIILDLMLPKIKTLKGN